MRYRNPTSRGRLSNSNWVPLRDVRLIDIKKSSQKKDIEKAHEIAKEWRDHG